MVKHSSPGNPDQYRQQLVELLNHFDVHLKNSDLRTQVLSLIPATKLMQNLGASLIQPPVNGARARILAYLQKYMGLVISGEELMIVSGISEYARRVRELRVEYGWRILTGLTLKDMDPNELLGIFKAEDPQLKPDQYILISPEQDTEAAYRWNVAHDIRKDETMSV